MIINTKYFGELQFDETEILQFPEGLFGFEEETTFLLIPFGDDTAPLLCLQSVTTPKLAFVVMNPFSLHPAYSPILQPAELKKLGVAESQELCYYVLCVVREPVSESTVNLKCPVVINDNNRTAIQVILDTTDYDMRHRLAEFQAREAGDPC